MNDRDQPNQGGSAGGRGSRRGSGGPSDDDEWEDEDAETAPRARRRPSRPANATAAAGGGGSDDVDDEDDDWDDDWRPERGAGTGRRDLMLVVGVAAVILIVVLVVVLTKKSNNNSSAATNNGGPATSGQTATTRGTLCGNLPPTLGGQAATSEKGPSGVYLWNDFQNLHVRAKGTAVTITITGSAPIKVKAKPADAKETQAYGASFTAWDAAAGKGGSATVSGNDLTIKIPANATPLGPNLDVSCDVKTLGIQVTGASGPLAVKDIHLGDSSQAPKNPFNLAREAG